MSSEIYVIERGCVPTRMVLSERIKRLDEELADPSDDNLQICGVGGSQKLLRQSASQATSLTLHLWCAETLIMGVAGLNNHQKGWLNKTRMSFAEELCPQQNKWWLPTKSCLKTQSPLVVPPHQRFKRTHSVCLLPGAQGRSFCYPYICLDHLWNLMDANYHMRGFH